MSIDTSESYSNRNRLKYLAGFVLVVVLCVSLFFAFKKEPEQVPTENPLADVAKVKKTVKTTPDSIPTSSQPTLPQPQDSPSDPYESIPVNELGSISIPKIGMTQKLYEGVWLTVLNVGPGHWPGTAMPGEYGNTVVAGHRVTHSKPFRNIDRLVVGDEIIVTTSTGAHTYKVTGSEVVTPKDIWIVDQTPGFRITLFACHPPGSARQRYVVYGELVNPPFQVQANL